MEHARGVNLYNEWPTLDPKQKIDCIGEIAMVITATASLEFPAYGSLYFADSSLELGSSVPLTPGFCIGSDCTKRHWDCNIGGTIGDPKYYNASTQPKRGPCKLYYL